MQWLTVLKDLRRTAEPKYAENSAPCSQLLLYLKPTDLFANIGHIYRILFLLLKHFTTSGLQILFPRSRRTLLLYIHLPYFP